MWISLANLKTHLWHPQPGVVDIISLNCASLRELDGGQRKRDLKRAFAIVEKSGTVHFVTAGSDAEYVTWVSGIQLAITFYSPKQPETSANGLSDLDASSHSKGEDARLQSSNHGKPLGRSIARVVNAAKVKGKSVAVRGMKSPWQESTSQIIDQEASINESTAGAMSNSLRESNKMVNSSDSTSSNTESRRQQLRNRFSGVSQATKRGLGSAGQVTKSRFGSVLSAAKQRGQEVAQKRRMRATTEPEDVFVDLSTASITPGAERVSTDEVWPCSACTFINPGDYTKCQVCESERSIPAYNISDLQSQDFTLECQLDDKDAVIDETDEINALDDLTEQGEKGSMRGDPFQSQGISSLPEDGEHSRDDDDRSIDAGNADDFNVDYHSITSDQLDDNEFDELEPRLRIKQRLGAAVRHARKVTSDSQRFSISRRNSRQENSERVPLGAPNSVKLRNIALSGPLKPPVHAFGEGCAAGAAMTGIPLKKFEGLWFARVEISSGSQPTKATTGISFRATAVDLAEELKVVDDSKNDKCETGDAETRDDGFMTTDSRSDGNEVRLSRSNALRATPPRVVEAGNNEEMTFRIQVFQHNGEQSSSLTTDVLKKLPEILALHTSLSESIARVPSYLFDSEPNVGRTCVAGMSENLTRTLGLTPLDAARITGKLLGGLLDVSQRRNLNLKLHSSYLGKNGKRRRIKL